jgi:cytochrome c
MICTRRIVIMLYAVLVSGAAAASPELTRAKNCGACHHLERKMLGPSFQAIAARYADDPAAATMLIERVIKGGGGKWGQLPMPAQANVSPDESEAIVKWILAQKP